MIKRIFSLFVLLVVAFSFIGCSANEIKADDLMRNTTAASVNGKAADGLFLNAAADFSFELFKNTISKKENSLISPTSVLLALAMTANGADNETLTQLEAVLGGNLKIQQLNEYLYSFVNGLPDEEKSHLNIANSIWFKDNNFTPAQQFLQVNADYYGASAYKSSFDDQTVKDINTWIKKNTDGLINSIIDKIPPDIIMYLINTVLFDAEWQSVYQKSSVKDGEFTAYDGEKQTVKFMHSTETKYLQGERVTGFVKPYFGNKYSFVALLPDETISVNEYAKTLSGEVFLNILKTESQATVFAALPKFSYGYSVEMNDALKFMGIMNAFSPANADFTKIGNADGNIFISQVLHKTFISVDERGTKAGAVTSVAPGMTDASECVYVMLNRPFIYAIIDNATKLPIFTGSLMTCK